MLSSRELMDVALKATVVPVLRGSGFTGSYPHFRRVHVTHVDLLTFQFDINEGGFLLEISRYGIGGITTQAGKHIPASKVRVWDLQPNDRFALSPAKDRARIVGLDTRTADTTRSRTRCWRSLPSHMTIGLGVCNQLTVDGPMGQKKGNM
jgi:hypothetical protein